MIPRFLVALPLDVAELAAADCDVVDDPRSDLAVGAEVLDIVDDAARDDSATPPSVDNLWCLNARIDPAVSAGPAADFDLFVGGNAGVVQPNVANEA